ncbi:two-component system, NtrC family, nitrogen regulation sensor histidine kinase GlnL [Fulvimarina manganoxydans]|uniref:histidine kinase n=1 Tax=Fulvimarina manganoxydans TaxID=937218 RepID=A0A1W2BTD6_9HYPH|nr:ATP-binding protein [Fulvimarina manganoxydans]SMC75986.1 two-component system, NtrC family, nitrogen regulation sensor histidine kinase GlnL [Fulvimarina manganoxydans]
MTAPANPRSENQEMHILGALPHPVIVCDKDGFFHYANTDAEQFFSASRTYLLRRRLQDFIPLDNPVFSLIEKVLVEQSRFSEYRVDLSSPRLGAERLVDLYVANVPETPHLAVVIIQLRSIAEKMDRQLTHRSAARTVTGLAAMLAHEIRNPLSGIKGAAQLLATSASDEDRVLTRLIQEESERIGKLVNRMEVFSDQRPIERSAVNIHSVLEYVKTIAKSGFARDIPIAELYDPSLPPVYANRDQLVQVFLNLVKNAAEAVTHVEKPEIRLTTAFRPGVRLSVPGSRDRVTLPLEFTVEDNGPGVPEDIRENIFDPFVTTKPSGSGLGLALVAKIIGDHGGVIECDSQPGHSIFRILMPAWKEPSELRTRPQGAKPLPKKSRG